MSNTQTPRTDAAESNWWSEDGLRSAFIVRADFARELERENAILTAERDEAWQNHDRVVREFSEGPSDCDPETGIQHGDLI